MRPALAAFLATMAFVALAATAASRRAPVVPELADAETTKDADETRRSQLLTHKETKQRRTPRPTTPPPRLPPNAKTTTRREDYPPFLNDYPARADWDLDELFPKHHEVLWRQTILGLTPESNDNALTEQDHCRADAPDVVRHLFTPWGFGSNLLVMVDDILYALLTRQRFVLVSNRDRDYAKEAAKAATFKRTARPLALSERLNLAPWILPVPLQQWYETHAAFARLPGVVCPSHQQTCAKARIPHACVGPTVTRRSVELLSRYQREHADTFNALRTYLLRELMRFDAATQEQVDAQVASVLASSSSSAEAAATTTTTVAVHIRRGDKLVFEASLTPASDYVAAILTALREEQQQQQLTIVILTDDAAAVGEFHAAWRQAPLPPTLKAEIRPRVALVRPDGSGLTNDADALHATMVDLLTDVKLMSLAHVFVGTQSSNVGVLACYLRGGVRCFNAEAPATAFTWNQALNKIK